MSSAIRVAFGYLLILAVSSVPTAAQNIPYPSLQIENHDVDCSNSSGGISWCKSTCESGSYGNVLPFLGYMCTKMLPLAYVPPEYFPIKDKDQAYCFCSAVGTSIGGCLDDDGYARCAATCGDQGKLVAEWTCWNNDTWKPACECVRKDETFIPACSAGYENAVKACENQKPVRYSCFTQPDNYTRAAWQCPNAPTTTLTTSTSPSPTDVSTSSVSSYQPWHIPSVIGGSIGVTVLTSVVVILLGILLL
ncbi:hypothetical protein BC832DRAFT_235712 [Gaertneriomyces semiglobifer]|nr:hypothetical protein BC832DRAFT_235712 [Gaertneriomyces semiglobifer]